jgi:hypothetical protein
VGLAADMSDQVEPFQLSASTLLFPNPTATQNEGPTHDSAFKMLVLPETFGLLAIDHLA